MRSLLSSSHQFCFVCILVLRWELRNVGLRNSQQSHAEQRSSIYFCFDQHRKTVIRSMLLDFFIHINMPLLIHSDIAAAIYLPHFLCQGYPAYILSHSSFIVVCSCVWAVFGLSLWLMACTGSR